MYISNVIFIILYALDIIAGAFIAGHMGAVVVAAALPVCIFIQIKLTLFKADVVRLENLNSHDRNRLSLAFENVLRKGESLGYTFKNPRIYLSEEESLNGFSCGNAIVINRGLLNSGCLEAVIAHEVKHFRFHDSITSCLICNTITVLFILIMFMTSIYILLIVLMAGLLAAFIGNGMTGIITGSVISRILGKIKNLFMRVSLFCMNAFQMVLSRQTEFKADEFAVRLGYGEQLKQFLRLTYNNRKNMSLTEQLLSSHPSDSKRIANIQKIQNELSGNGAGSTLPFNY